MGGIECLVACRMMGIEVLKYFQTFIKKSNEGCRDFKKMMPVQLNIN
ncbi:MAG: hypothetical protein LKF81_09385 [Prevotella sp.]|jgi:hypothetical protein|nr:hypothetical protein [Prevotella sp.]